MSNFLQRMAAGSRLRADAAERKLPAEALAARIRRLSPPPPLRLSPLGFDLIAELKCRSPSAGVLAAKSLGIEAQAGRYVGGGAAALSVLTEPEEFSGHLDHLAEAASRTAAIGRASATAVVPVMRKDFLVSPYQLLEGRAAGAGGVLLIAAILDDHALRGMLRATHGLGMFALVEVFDMADLRRAAAAIRAAGPAVAEGRYRTLLGVNCRDLRTLAVDFGRFAALAPGNHAGIVPGDLPWVAESGVESPAQAARVAGLGYRVALVGTALMRAADPSRLGAELLAAGRASAFESRRGSAP